MSDQRFAQDVHQTFADAGSFYISSMKGKAREQAVSFVGTGLATSLQSNVENTIHNLVNDADFNYKCVNYDFVFTVRDITLSNDGCVIIHAPLDIHISSIDICLADNTAKLLLPAIDFIQEVEETDIESVRYKQYKSIKLFNRDLIGPQGRNLKSLSFNINGTYTRESTIRNFLLKSYIGASHAPLGNSLKFITDYVGGYNQDINAFKNFLEAIAGSIYLDGAWRILGQYSTAFGGIYVIAKITGYDEYSNPILDDTINVVKDITHFVERGQLLSNEFITTVLKDQTTEINDDAETLAASLGNPVINLTVFDDDVGLVKANELRQAIENNLPFGYIQGENPLINIPKHPTFTTLPIPPLPDEYIETALYYHGGSISTAEGAYPIIYQDTQGNAKELKVVILSK